MQIWLTLANGQQYSGTAANYNNQDINGELVFNTGMTGYEDTLTDPSYAGQILVFTYPLIGNYGVRLQETLESDKIHVKAVICNQLIDNQEHHQATTSFIDWLKEHNIPVITGIDTRQLTRDLREDGTMDCIISENEKAIPKLSTKHEMAGSSEIIYHGNGKHKIILLDCGVKKSIIRNLLNFDVTIKQVPHDYDYSNEDYAGILLSNGPGNPEDYGNSITVLKKTLAGNKPIFGICLGSQLLGLASGASTYKLKFGHRGQNQPCQDTNTLKCYLTAQNHNYALDEKSISSDWNISFRHLHDGSVAGISHYNKPYSAVQFHPEAAAGPNDTAFLFESFFNQIKIQGLIT